MSDPLPLLNKMLLEAGDKLAKGQLWCKSCGSPVPHNSKCKEYGDHAAVVDGKVTDVRPFRFPRSKRENPADPVELIPDSQTEVKTIKNMVDFVKTGICNDQTINAAVEAYAKAVMKELTSADETSSYATAGFLPLVLAQRACLTVILLAEKEIAQSGKVLSGGEPTGAVKFLVSYLTCFRHGQQSLGLIRRARAKSAAIPSLTSIEREYAKEKNDGE